MAMALITPPSSQPVSLIQVKQYLKVENNNDDQLIADLIVQATTHIQNITGQKLITQTWRIYFDDLPQSKILELSIAPVIAMAELRYFDSIGDAQIVPPDDYELDRISQPARLWVKKTLPAGHQLNGVEVDVHAGFGASSIDIPGDITRALMVTIAHWYEFRGAIGAADQPVSNPDGLSRLLAAYAKAKL